MSLSVVVLFCLLCCVSGQTDSNAGFSDKVTCRYVMTEIRSLFEKQEAKFQSLTNQISDIAMIVRSLEQNMLSVQFDLREVKSVKLGSITTSVRSLEQGMASVQYDLREVKSVKLANITTSVRSLEQGMASVQLDLREVKSATQVSNAIIYHVTFL